MPTLEQVWSEVLLPDRMRRIGDSVDRELLTTNQPNLATNQNSRSGENNQIPAKQSKLQ